jgi:hypothetical protein
MHAYAAERVAAAALTGVINHQPARWLHFVTFGHSVRVHPNSAPVALAHPKHQQL